MSGLRVMRWQYLAYFMRFSSLCCELYLLFSSHYFEFDPRNALAVCLTVVVIANDLVLLTWDLYFHGCFLAITVVQILISLNAVICSIGIMVAAHFFFSPYGVYGDFLVFLVSIMCPTFAVLFSFMLVFMSTQAWINGPKGAWKMGVKDLACANPPRHNSHSSRVSFLGKRRKPGDDIRVGLVWAGLKAGFIRQIPEVETLKFALCRNIMAVVLLVILIARSAQLFYGVFGPAGKQETWGYPQTAVAETSPILTVFTEIDELPPTLYMSTQDSDSSLSDLLAVPLCDWYLGPRLKDGNFSICSINSSTSQFINIAVVSDAGGNATSSGLMWLSLASLIPVALFPKAPYYVNPIHLVAGTHLFARIDIVEYRSINPSLWSLIGFAPTHSYDAMAYITSEQQLPLANNSIAQATLEWERNITYDMLYNYRIIQEYDQHTFLNVLSSMGGLLVIAQGLHLTLFGRPLLWGLFGSKALNPFGMIGLVSPDIRKNMIARYGYIPNSSSEGDSDAQKLALFLSDFVLNAGPLYKRDEDMEREEEGDIRSEEYMDVSGARLLRRRSDERADSTGDDIEMLGMESGHISTERNTSQ